MAEREDVDRYFGDPRFAGDEPEEPVKCPVCGHSSDDHDELGCGVPDCDCTGP